MSTASFFLMMVYFKSGLALAALFSTVTGVTTAGEFDVVSMNVAGLPPIFNGNEIPGDKTTNSKLIGTYLGRYKYDIVHMQEG